MLVRGEYVLMRPTQGGSVGHLFCFGYPWPDLSVCYCQYPYCTVNSQADRYTSEGLTAKVLLVTLLSQHKFKYSHVMSF